MDFSPLKISSLCLRQAKFFHVIGKQFNKTLHVKTHLNMHFNKANTQAAPLNIAAADLIYLRCGKANTQAAPLES